jgi:hypothetical protein
MLRASVTTCPNRIVRRRNRVNFLRKHYYFRPSEDGFDAWDVDHPVEASQDFPVVEMPLSSIDDIDSVYWIGEDGSAPTVRILVSHMQLVKSANLDYPIIIGADGRVMDGMHRVAKALLEDRSTILAVTFDVQPEPDHRNIRPSDLMS